MPGFLYTTLVVDILCWIFVIRYMITIKPQNTGTIVPFLVLLFVALSLTFTFPIYFYFHTKAPLFTNLRAIFRRSLKWGVYFSLGIVFLLGLKAFKLFNIFNLVLFAVLYLGVFVQIKGKR
jgi:hypothetical protein